MVSRSELETYLNDLLNIHEFKDYGPNGLQVEGKAEIKKICFCVSATKKSIEFAIKENCDAMVVHHGLFWVFHGPRPITGPFAKRVIPLIKNDINLFGYHLPLDAHLEVGNASAIAKAIELKNLAPFGDHKGSPIGIKGEFSTPQNPEEMSKKLSSFLDHQVIHAKAESRKISSMGIITGGANSGWQDAYKEGLDSYLTGEISEHDWHESSEWGVHMFAGGHNATENFGVQELSKKIEENYKVECVFYQSDNPA